MALQAEGRQESTGGAMGVAGVVSRQAECEAIGAADDAAAGPPAKQRLSAVGASSHADPAAGEPVLESRDDSSASAMVSRSSVIAKWIGWLTNWARAQGGKKSSEPFSHVGRGVGRRREGNWGDAGLPLGLCFVPQVQEELNVPPARPELVADSAS